MAWYKIVVQPFLVVYRGLYPSKENCMIFRKVTGFGPWFHAVGTGSFWLRGIHGSVTKELIWLPRSCCPAALSVIVSRWIAADSSVLFTIKLCCYGFNYRIFGYWLILCVTHRHCIKMACIVDQETILSLKFHLQNVSSSFQALPVKNLFFRGLVMADQRCASFRYRKEFNKHYAILKDLCKFLIIIRICLHPLVFFKVCSVLWYLTIFIICDKKYR